MTIAAGTRLGPYQIDAALGEGGMGDVYRATDTRLGRTVAIKRIKPAHADRFRREAQTIASLNHPHICTLYDVGPDYLVMEYIDGAPLRGPVAAGEALRLALQIVAALEAAHARGIIHRDLKPANILITGSGVKLLDFGLAKQLGGTSDETVDPHTRTGTVLGTAAYMSPEQASGRAADERSDIFSFGAVLYELLSGRAPFSGDTFITTAAAVLHGDPAPLEAAGALRAIVTRCLRKTPAERFQTARDLREALEAAASTTAVEPAVGTSSIAVLPFANMSGDKDNEYFSDGLAEEILNALTRVPALKVAARTSSFAFRGRDQDVRKIAETLDVRTILEGSVRRAGSRIRVTAQLIDASNGYHLWSERYDRELTDVFEVQDEIAAAITGALRLTLAPPTPADQRYVPRFPAYEAFLQGRYHFARQTAEDLPRAIACYQRAVALDPGYPDPHVELGAAYMILWYFGLKSAHEIVPLIVSESRQARQEGNTVLRANGLLGIVAAAYDYNQEEAERLLQLALAERWGTEAEARWCYATFYLSPRGRFDAARDLLTQSLQDGDPLNVVWRGAIAQNRNMAGRHEEALEALGEMMALDNRYWIGHLYMAESYAALGRWQDARAPAEEAYRLAPWSARVNGMLAAVLARTGEPDRSREIVTRLTTASLPHWGPAGMVLYSVLAEDVDLAADWYQRAIDQRDVWVLIQSSGWLTKRLRQSPHWPAFSRQLGLRNRGMGDGSDGVRS